MEETFPSGELQMYVTGINVFYREEQVLKQGPGNYSKSPLKPKLLLEFLKKNGFKKYLKMNSDWKPFTKEEFLIAHTVEYVTDFFSGTGNCSSNGLAWNEQFADSVRYTNASLFRAIEGSILNPYKIAFSPTSGFHHAGPNRGSGFCTFSGQVIASLKIYRKWGAIGAYIDLDGHYGNSIRDSFGHDEDVERAIAYNINPHGHGQTYLDDLDKHLKLLEKDLLAGKVHYVVFCHGADSHEWDQLGSQVSTEQWFKASEMVYTMIKRVTDERLAPVPLTLSLFGGYRDDDYESVLSLHAGDIQIALRILLGIEVDFKPVVKEPKGGKWYDWYEDEKDEDSEKGIKCESSVKSIGFGSFDPIDDYNPFSACVGCYEEDLEHSKECNDCGWTVCGACVVIHDGIAYCPDCYRNVI